jgi:predicted RND superfamily exporter protein
VLPIKRQMRAVLETSPRQQHRKVSIVVFVGMLLLMGILGWLGISLNAANMIVLPLILGIGIDDGIHVVHDFRHQRPGHYLLGESTASAVVTTSATTMIGFGSMMLSHHQGLQSLGQVLTLGVAMCMVTSLFLLPAVLTLIDLRRRKQIESEKTEPTLKIADTLSDEGPIVADDAALSEEAPTQPEFIVARRVA